MRITNKVLTKGYLSDLNRNLQNMRKFQEQLSSGKEIRRPSDNPFKVARAMELHTSVAANNRYRTNVDEGIGWMQTADTALGQIGEALNRAKELATAGGNGAYGTSELESIKKEFEQVKAQLVQIGNTSYDGRYIFSGDKTTTVPFDTNGTYLGSSDGLLREFSQGVIMDISIRGDQFQDIFNTMDNIISDLNSNNSPGARIGDLNSKIDKVLQLRGQAGAKTYRLEAMASKNDEEILNMTELVSKTEDVDVAEKVMQYKVMESVYMASLQTGAKILQPSILDFLR